MLSNRNFCALQWAMTSASKGRSGVTLIAAPMTHVAGRAAICSLSSGQRMVILDKVDLQSILHAIQEQRITDLFLPPTGVYALLDLPNIRDFDCYSLQRYSYGSAPISIPRLKEALQVFGPVMSGGFGQTECPMFISRLEPEEHFENDDVNGGFACDARLRSVGRATSISSIAIVDDSGMQLPAGELGEIAVKGPMVSEGFYQSPQETAKIRVNGWQLPSDVGYLDSEDFLYIVDRKKDMISSGGFNVYSTEVEQTIANCSVRDIVSAGDSARSSSTIR